MGHLRDRMAEDLRLGGFSPNTVRSYLHYAKNFAKHFMRSPADMGAAQVRCYLLHLLDKRKLSHTAYRQSYAALKFLYTVTLGRAFEVQWIPRPRKKRTLPVVLSGTEVQALLGSIESFKYRMVAMVMYAAGLRISEACRLRPEDIDSKRMLIHVRQGKGGKDRYVMLSRQLLNALRAYWRECRPPEYLFPGARNAGHLSREAVRLTLRRAAARAGLRKDVTPHMLRHSFATHLLETGTDVTVIKALLGHNDIKTTSLYTSVSTRHIQGLRSPLDLLGTLAGKVLG